LVRRWCGQWREQARAEHLFPAEERVSEDISGVQVNAVFRDVKQDGIIGEHFVPAIGSDTSLKAGATTNAIVLRSKVGFTGTETRAQMLRNSRFVDARVMILGRHGRRNWARMAQFPVDRKLLTE
jgi:hypothetical protein